MIGTPRWPKMGASDLGEKNHALGVRNGLDGGDRRKVTEELSKHGAVGVAAMRVGVDRETATAVRTANPDDGPSSPVQAQLRIPDRRTEAR